ncbi:MAG: response regulator [Deltaproteobacteria bacterium]|nr:response regulator [Deltaproteobacteria bacterium]MBI3017343.1 response regulator [Deltaproteobacteria bacterium]
MVKKILLVDDEKDLVDTIQILLEAKGYSVVSAHDGLAGLEKAKKEKPDLILLDVMMPNLNGYQLCREIKKDPNLKNTPIVMLTAKAQESDRFWGIESGADDYVTKPFDSLNLLETIKNNLK